MPEYYKVLQSIIEYYRVFLAHLLGPISGLVFDRTRVHKHKLLVEQKHSFKLKHPIPGFVVRIEMFHISSKVVVHVVSPHGITSARSIDIDLTILLAAVVYMHIYADTE